MKKQFAVCVLLLVMVFALTGCTKGSSVLLESVEMSEADSWSISYKKFNGYKEREVNLTGDEEHSFFVEVTTNSGNLALSISNEDGTTLYTGNKMPSSTFEVKAKSAEKYTIRFTADNHQGSWSVKWK